MDWHPLVSVIVPIFNVEPYLRQCVYSITSQSLKEIEIILVDDASPDASGAIADELSKLDDRIRVIHHSNNAGLGPARNSGIEIAKGDYLMFVDSDDWIDSDMVESLYTLSRQKGLDICFCGRRVVTDGVIKSESPHPLADCVVHGAEKEAFRRELYGALPEKVVDSPIPVSAWAALYKRSLIQENRLRFINIRSEDTVFNIPACAYAETIGFHTGVFYNYRKDQQASITNTVSGKSIASFVPFFIKLKDLALSEPEKYRQECVLRASRRIIDLTRGAVYLVMQSCYSRRRKYTMAKSLIANEVVIESLESYPFWKTPGPQAIFTFCMKHGLLAACEILSDLRSIRE